MNIFAPLFQSRRYFDLTPGQVQSWLEYIWANGSTGWWVPSPSPLPDYKPTPDAPGGPAVIWPHLIYAYMIENTLVYEIFAKAIREYVSGEVLGPPDAEAAQWLRLTEALMYRHPAATLSYAVESELRPDHRAVRRNAYHRMFGMDLNHGAGPSSQEPYPFLRASAANRDFVSVLEELLRELWIAHTNIGNTSGPRATDNARIGDLAQRLHNMLLLRRQGWSLAREEFFAVATMSWFEYALSDNSVIVKSLKAEGPSRSSRLGKIAQMVKMPLPRFAYEYFQMAQPLSNLLQLIETHPQWDNGSEAALYSTGIITDVLAVIDAWSRATGRDLKATRVQMARPA